jgi:hypothetical protein
MTEQEERFWIARVATDASWVFMHEPEAHEAETKGWEVIALVPASRVQELEGERDSAEQRYEEADRDYRSLAARCERAESHLARLEEALKEAATNDDYAGDIARRALGASIPHDVGIDCLDGGHKGYQAVCWECGWRGTEHLRGDEEMGTPESRSHKTRAREEAAEHRKESLALTHSTPPREDQ